MPKKLRVHKSVSNQLRLIRMLITAGLFAEGFSRDCALVSMDPKKFFDKVKDQGLFDGHKAGVPTIIEGRLNSLAFTVELKLKNSETQTELEFA